VSFFDHIGSAVFVSASIVTQKLQKNPQPAPVAAKTHQRGAALSATSGTEAPHTTNGPSMAEGMAEGMRCVVSYQLRPRSGAWSKLPQRATGSPPQSNEFDPNRTACALKIQEQ